MEELAQELSGDEEALLERWEGRPDLIIEDVFRVRDLETKEVTNLELTDYQRQFVHALYFGDASTVSVLKGRRTGYSFIACASILLKALTLPHSFHAITGPSKSQAKDRIEDIYDLIEWARIDIELEIDNRDEIELARNSATIMAFAGNPDTSRGGDSADILFIDEMDFLEDQEESMRAFSPFVALGDANTIQLSTPRYSNSLFAEDIERGSPTGENGIIAIEQPAFENPKAIDEEVSLLDQDVEPVMPYLNLEEAEKDRQRDPTGFRQEYLCETVEDTYRFFTESGIDRAQARGESIVWSPATHAREGGKMIMGVDIGTDGDDDTALAVFEHDGRARYLRFHTTLDSQDLNAVGIMGDPANPSDVASYIYEVVQNMGVDKVFLDKTGPGKGYQQEINRLIGRKAEGFNFTDKKEVKRMMGDFNYALHNDLITLAPDKTIGEQLKAIVKEQKHDSSIPRFSGKDHAPNGKDDLAMAMVLGAHPPNFDADRERTARTRDNVSGYEDTAASSEPSPERFHDVENVAGGTAEKFPFAGGDGGSANRTHKTRSRRENRQYDRRHSR